MQLLRYENVLGQVMVSYRLGLLIGVRKRVRDVRLSELTEKYIPRTLFAWKTIAVTVEEVLF